MAGLPQTCLSFTVIRFPLFELVYKMLVIVFLNHFFLSVFPVSVTESEVQLLLTQKPMKSQVLWNGKFALFATCGEGIHLYSGQLPPTTVEGKSCCRLREGLPQKQRSQFWQPSWNWSSVVWGAASWSLYS